MFENQTSIICQTVASLQKAELHTEAGILFQAFEEEFERERWEEAGVCIHEDDGNGMIFTCKKCGFADGP